jgi:hypothetical protein
MNGDISLAIKKYNKAYKLDPSLEGWLIIDSLDK